MDPHRVAVSDAVQGERDLIAVDQQGSAGTTERQFGHRVGDIDSE